MKKKAVAEFECLSLLRQILTQMTGEPVEVARHGSDALRWFTPHADVSGAPDFRAVWEGGCRLYEFQIAVKENLKFFDFKLSKVRKRKKKVVIPHTDREFFYIAAAEERVGFIEPQWILDNGQVGGIPAWGNRTGYRVPRDVFLPMLAPGGERLRSVLTSIADKTLLLEFQREFFQQEADRLAHRLRQIVDEREKFQIVPGTLNGFFEACFLLSRTGRFPDDAGVWLVYLFSFLDRGMTPEELARIAFSIDFLYFRAVAAASGGQPLRANEQRVMLDGLQRVADEIATYKWKDGSIDPHSAPLEELRQMLFVVDRFEDWRQDVAASLGGERLPPAARLAERIFEMVPDVKGTAERVREASRSSA